MIHTVLCVQDWTDSAVSPDAQDCPDWQDKKETQGPRGAPETRDNEASQALMAETYVCVLCLWSVPVPLSIRRQGVV